MRSVVLVVILSSMLCACSSRDRPSSDAGDTGILSDTAVDTSPVDTGPPTDTTVPPGDTALCTDPLDIVFVIDVSTSMADEIEQVGNGMDSIWAAASALTTDVQYGLVVFVDDVVAVDGCAPFADLAAMQAAFATWRTFTTTNGQPAGGTATNTDCPENSLDALHTAATVCPWRAGATHIAIHVTDDTFVEPPLSLSAPVGGIGGIPVRNTYLETVAALVAAEVRVGAFAAPGAGEDCGAGASANVGQGFHEHYATEDAIPVATGGQAWSIRDVRAGTLDMADAINAFTAAEYCTLF